MKSTRWSLNETPADLRPHKALLPYKVRTKFWTQRGPYFLLARSSQICILDVRCFDLQTIQCIKRESNLDTISRYNTRIHQCGRCKSCMTSCNVSSPLPEIFHLDIKNNTTSDLLIGRRGFSPSSSSLNAIITALISFAIQSLHRWFPLFLSSPNASMTFCGTWIPNLIFFFITRDAVSLRADIIASRFLSTWVAYQ